MRLKILILNGLIVLAFAGCATNVLSPDKLTTVSKVGVMSIHGNSMDAIERGLTIFGNEDTVNNISSWNIDEFIREELIKNFSNTQLTVLPIPLSEEEIIAFSVNPDIHFDLYKKYMIKHNVDTLLIANKKFYAVDGIGIVKHKGLGIERTNLLFNLILFGYQLIEGELKLFHFNIIDSGIRINNNLWKDTTKPVSKNNLLQIQKIVKKALSSDISKTMEVIGYKESTNLKKESH